MKAAITLSEGLDPNKVFLVNSSELEGRLDPVFYRPSILSFISKIKLGKYSAQPVSQISHRIVDGPFGTQLKVEDYQEKGVPVIRVSNVRTGKISEENLVKISPEKHRRLLRSRVLPDDVILTKAGAILGYSAVFPKHLKEGNITSHSVTITCKSNINPHYLKYVFQSSIGQKQIYRWGNKSTRPELNIGEVSKILVPVPDTTTQNNIVQLMDNAYKKKEQKEAESQKLLDSINDFLLSELGIKLPERKSNILKHRIFTSNKKNLIAVRYDSYYHQEYFEAIDHAVKNGKHKCQQMKDIIRGYLTKGYLPKDDEKEGECKVVQISAINADGAINTEDLLTAKNVFSKKQKMQPDDILVVITGATIGKIGLWDQTGDYYLGGDIVKFMVNDYMNPHFVFSYLKSQPAQVAIKRNITGATNGHLSPYDFKHVLIPVPSVETQSKISITIKEIREKAFKLREVAQIEVEKATKEMEGRILGAAT